MLSRLRCSLLRRSEEALRTMEARHSHSSSRKSRPVKDKLRHVKMKENRRQGSGHAGPATVYAQVVGAGSRDNGASLYVFSEFNRYLFNCAEGTQRLMQEHKMKIARLDNIFLTRMSWDTVGGLSGMILTLQETGVTQCVLSGPPQLEKYLNAIRVFSGPLENIKLAVRPYTGAQHTDETMNITQVPLFSEHKADGCSPESGQKGALRRPEEAQESLKSRRRSTSPESKRQVTRDPSLVVAYVCKIHPKKGNFLVMKAKEMGLPVGTAAIGPIIADLKAGKPVMFEGKEIQPEELCTPTDPGPVFIVIDCPSEDFIQSLSTNPILQRYQSGGSEESASLVVHMTPESVLDTEQYQSWMERFPSSTEHLLMNEQTFTTHNARSHKLQTQLNLIHPEIFPPLTLYPTKAPATSLRVPSVRAQCLMRFQLLPKKEWQRDAVLSCDSEEFVKEAADVPNFLVEVEECRRFRAVASVSASGERFPEVVFLGTGSSLPMKTRNVSATLVNISSSRSLLLDCGEGTFGQLCRHYGDDVDEILCKLSTIFVSHLHADHHTGLIHLLYERERALRTLGKAFSPVYLIAPNQIMTWLNQYHHHCQAVLRHIDFVPSKCLTDDAEPPIDRTKAFIQAVLKKNDLLKFETCLVRHCKNAFACSLSHQSGWKLVFSGDTMPCDALVNMGKNATLLIHEATLEDGMEDEAFDKRHSTTSQAIDIGMKMNAEFIVLNHFSQRYAKIPLFSDDFNNKVGISFDHMRMRFGDFPVLPRLLRPLKALFAQEIEDLEERRERREMKKSTDHNGETEMGKGAKREQDELKQEVDTKRFKAN